VSDVALMRQYRNERQLMRMLKEREAMEGDANAFLGALLFTSLRPVYVFM
jgi:hypothetical protein